jgi:hypothetical protein
VAGHGIKLCACQQAMLLYTLALSNRGDCFNIRTSALCLCGVLMRSEMKTTCLAINLMYPFFGDELLTLRKYRGDGDNEGNTTKYKYRNTAFFIN